MRVAPAAPLQRASSSFLGVDPHPSSPQGWQKPTLIGSGGIPARSRHSSVRRLVAREADSCPGWKLAAGSEAAGVEVRRRKPASGEHTGKGLREMSECLDPLLPEACPAFRSLCSAAGRFPPCFKLQAGLTGPDPGCGSLDWRRSALVTVRESPRHPFVTWCQEG